MRPHAPLLLSAAALGLVAALSLTGQEAGPAPAPAKPAPHVTLFSNVRIFDGKSDTLSAPSNVLVRGNLIEKVSTDPIPTDHRGDTVLIDGGGQDPDARPDRRPCPHHDGEHPA